MVRKSSKKGLVGVDEASIPRCFHNSDACRRFGRAKSESEGCSCLYRAPSNQIDSKKDTSMLEMMKSIKTIDV